jgi:hypothetical protein
MGGLGACVPAASEPAWINERWGSTEGTDALGPLLEVENCCPGGGLGDLQPEQLLLDLSECRATLDEVADHLYQLFVLHR